MGQTEQLRRRSELVERETRQMSDPRQSAGPLLIVLAVALLLIAVSY